MPSFLGGVVVVVVVVVVGFVLIELVLCWFSNKKIKSCALGVLEDTAAPKHSSERALTGPCGIFIAFFGRMGLLLEARVFAGALFCISSLQTLESQMKHMLVTFGMQKVVWC